MDVNPIADTELAEEFLKRNLLSPGQLKAALDYQASLGGGIAEVVVKLGLTQEEVLDDFLQRLQGGEDFVLGEEEKVDPERQTRLPPFDVALLRVHKKLLDKAPSELVERCGILLFFPPAGSRVILVSAEPALSPSGVKKLRDLLCVELVPIELTAEERAAFHDGENPAPRVVGLQVGSLSEEAQEYPVDPEEAAVAHSEAECAVETTLRAVGAAVKALEEQDDSPPSAGESEEVARRIAEDSTWLLHSLVRLLVKKEIISPDDLMAERNLLARQRAEVTSSPEKTV